ncbi:MalY/PatB family protein [Pseudobutyrivibrio xylanivorans]|uniref:cysteine-S-conjugate beta-lyase n=1 Tax=Pseudobutyrivibrio xylanivorans DSM 14809 TaxID=1123012 RepID=A0A1M6FUY6_PSEXY|nr:MalY/PatB family protein [Pseudobutyrivibrio xylanivorans]SHJ01518.1 cystathione beta-lyase [Pseudobutyrivibrio xylanivorans DSM 14809]
MGKYNFDAIVNRRGTDSMKWDVAENELPMWVADMDFQTAPEIIEALQKRVAEGVFGYTDVNDDWYEAYINWWKNRHGFEIDRQWLMFCTGVIPAISSIVRKLTTPNEKVIIQTPVYNIFFNSIINNGCRPLENPLHYEDGIFKMDFEDLEEKMSDPQASLMILCNPHNPVGKIWSREDLAKVGELAAKYGVTVISDEIHCDLVEPGKEYVPFASVSDTCKDVSITCIAPTKTFSIPGIQTAAIFVPNRFLRHKVWRGINTDEVAEPNVFAAHAAVAAFNHGGQWLDELREYLFENRRRVEAFVDENIPELHVVRGDATYLLWIDVSATGVPSNVLAAKLRKDTGLYLSAGTAYGDCGKDFLRMNVACTKATLEDGLERLKTGIEIISI